MSRSIKLITYLWLTLSFSTVSQAEVAIIVHPSNADSLTEQGVVNLFLGKKRAFPSGATAVPLNLDPTHPTSVYFNDSLLKKNANQLKAYWARMMFSGTGSPPKVVTDSSEMIKRVAENPNLIGYVNASEVGDSVRVIMNL